MVGLLEAADLGLVRAGERAALVAEQLRLEELLGERSAVDGDERTGAARAEIVDRARDQLLAGARLAGDQHGGVALGGALDHAEHALHRLGAPDQLAQAIGLARAKLQAPARPRQHQRALDGGAHLFVGERLDQVLVRAQPHGLDGRLHRRVRGHQDHLDLGRARADAAQHLEAVHARHRQIAQHHLRVVVEALEALFARTRGDHLALPVVAEQDRQRAPHVGLIVDDEDARP